MSNEKRVREERQSRKVKKDQSRERSVAAMSRDATVENEGGRERGRERLRMKEPETENRSEGHRERGRGDKGMRREQRSRRGGLRRACEVKSC